MFLVVFRNRKRADMDAASYAADAAAMAQMAAAQPGYRAFKSYTADDGEVVAISEWDDEASARAWGRLAEHRAVQHKGRTHYYADYTLFACDAPRVHRFEGQER
ncbi:antibiotic biosynthesis monooxygenase [Altererythrobacter aerius]|uniref:Antibiotic biosynthesis monooxygenase n=1 Tax=Tsuneonella aeria TaxID=1837929 RepID=A0A6I4TDN9_9SPHN|nr:antibiotic biosynthesis monooxygenase [Tsuneonella aeria]MXO75709.1 antibiotic biosynthesis monooxygenase [Tsuneonella aeria]